MKSALPLLLGAAMAFAAGCTQQPTPEKPDGSELVVTPQPYFLHLSDVHLDIMSDCTDGNSDTGMDLWKIAFAQLQTALSQTPPPQFVLYTGDLPVHLTLDAADPCNAPCLGGTNGEACREESIVGMLQYLDSLVQGNGIPLYYLPGNNDGLYGDYASFAELMNGDTVTALDSVPNDPFPALNAAATCGNPPCMVSANLEAGYYCAQLLPGLRLIALNTVIFNHNYTAEDNIPQNTAASSELAWMGQQLASAQAAGQKVYVAMHIPPGNDYYDGKPFWKPAHPKSVPTPWQNQFLSLVETHQSTIAAVLYGHSHMDEFRLLMSPSNPTQIMELATSAPGITPQHGNNPGFKLVYYNPTTFEITDFVTQYTTLPVQQSYGSNSYRFSSILPCTGGASLFSCVQAMDSAALVNAVNYIYTVRRDTTEDVANPSSMWVKMQ